MRVMDDTRRAYISELEDRFKPFTDALNKELQNWRFNFVEQKSAHLLHLNQALVVRHSFPYCISEETYFSLSDQDVKFFAAVILLHSLALTRIDDYYDGGHKTKGGMLKVDGVAYSLSATHEAVIALLKRAPNTTELAKLLKVTAFVHARMYKDYTERYRKGYLDRAEQRVQMYLHSSKSRLLGSGYWEVMARASFAQRGKAFPSYLHSVDIKLRKLRQIVDELADVEEDLRGGLITLPVLHALTQRPRAMRKSILNYWQSDNENGSDPSMTQLLEETQTKKWVYEQAMPLYWAGIKELDSRLGNRGDGYRRLFEYKRAKLEMLVKD